MPRILMFSTDMKPGGIRISFANYARSLIRSGFEVGIAVPAHSCLAEDFWNDPDVLVVPFNKSLFALTRWAGVPPPGLSSALRQADVIVCHNNRLIAFAKRFGKPVIAICHSDKCNHLNKADRIIVLSREAREKMRKWQIAPDKLRLLPHFVRIPTTNPIRSQNSIPVICAGGRFVRKKGFDVLAHAAALLKARGVNFRMVLFGAGEELEKIEQFCQEHALPVTFPGWVNVEDIFKGADIFCLPSHSEPFGLILAEAMGQELPCVATRCHGPLEMIEDGKTGLLCPIGDPVGVADALQRFVESPQLRNTVGRAARKAIMAPKFSRQRFDEKLAILIREVLP